LPVDLRAALGQLDAAVQRLPAALREEVGVFGSLDTTMPWAATWVWTVILLVLVGLALGLATCHHRVVLTGVVAIALVAPVAISALMVSGTGFDVQGRHVLALTVMVPLLASEIVFQQRSRVPRHAMRLGLTAAAISLSVVQCVAWFWSARRHAVGIDGPLWFIGAAEWSPPGGWWPWLVMVVIGAASVALVAKPRRSNRVMPD
jgi:hypothetical protein